MSTPWDEDHLQAKKTAFPHQEPSWPAPWSWTCQLPELWEIGFCFLSHLVHGILLQPHKLANTNIENLNSTIIQFDLTDTLRTFHPATAKIHSFQVHMEQLRETLSWIKKQSYRASLVAQLVKTLSAMQETLVRFLGQEDLLEKG